MNYKQMWAVLGMVMLASCASEPALAVDGKYVTGEEYRSTVRAALEFVQEHKGNKA